MDQVCRSSWLFRNIWSLSCAWSCLDPSILYLHTVLVIKCCSCHIDYIVLHSVPALRLSCCLSFSPTTCDVPRHFLVQTGDSWYIPWTSSLSAFPWTHRSSHLPCPAKGICRSRWKGKTVSPCLLLEVNLLVHKAQSLERTEEMVSVKKKWLSGCCSFLTSAQSVLAALKAPG